MIFVLSGIIGLVASTGTFVYALPRNGIVRPFVGTVIEPYVAIAVSMGFMMSLGAITKGLFGLL